MRRLLLVAGLTAGLAGCDGVQKFLISHADVAAKAAGQKLKAERLGDYMSRTPGMQINRDMANLVANTWVDYSLFAQALAQRMDLTDSTTIASAMWPQILEIKGSQWHDVLISQRGGPSPAQADSVYASDSVRVLQHILFRAEAGSPTAKAGAKQKATTAMARLKGGTNFGALASQVSEDPGSKADQGYLPPGPKGQFVAPFDSAGWLLQPGGVSGVVETSFGYHIIRRPPAPEVQARLVAWMNRSGGARQDSLYMDSLVASKKLTISPAAPAIMKAALANPGSALNSDKKLATFTGGALTVAQFTRWLRALPPHFAVQLQTANDTMLTKFARAISQNLILIQQADSAGITLTADQWNQIRDRYTQDLDVLRSAMAIGGPEISDSAVPASQRATLAAEKVDTFFDQVLSGRLRPQPLPSQLAVVLRQRLPNEVDPRGVTHGMELGLATQKKDSTTGSQSGIRPAPGPAPVPQAPTGSDSATSGSKPTAP